MILPSETARQFATSATANSLKSSAIENKRLDSNLAGLVPAFFDRVGKRERPAAVQSTGRSSTRTFFEAIIARIVEQSLHRGKKCLYFSP